MRPPVSITSASQRIRASFKRLRTSRRSCSSLAKLRVDSTSSPTFPKTRFPRTHSTLVTLQGSWRHSAPSRRSFRRKHESLSEARYRCTTWSKQGISRIGWGNSKTTRRLDGLFLETEARQPVRDFNYRGSGDRGSYGNLAWVSSIQPTRRYPAFNSGGASILAP